MLSTFRWVIPEFEKLKGTQFKLQSDTFCDTFNSNYGNWHLTLEPEGDKVAVKLYGTVDLPISAVFRLIVGFHRIFYISQSIEFSDFCSFHIWDIPKEYWTDQGVSDDSLVINLTSDFLGSKYINPYYLLTFSQDEKYSDTTVKLADGQIKANRNVLYVISQVLTKKLRMKIYWIFQTVISLADNLKHLSEIVF